jgi:hypothetical protein
MCNYKIAKVKNIKSTIDNMHNITITKIAKRPTARHLLQNIAKRNFKNC